MSDEAKKPKIPNISPEMANQLMQNMPQVSKISGAGFMEDGQQMFFRLEAEGNQQFTFITTPTVGGRIAERLGNVSKMAKDNLRAQGVAPKDLNPKFMEPAIMDSYEIFIREADQTMMLRLVGKDGYVNEIAVTAEQAVDLANQLHTLAGLDAGSRKLN